MRSLPDPGFAGDDGSVDLLHIDDVGAENVRPVMGAMRTADFNFIYVFRRKDGGVLDAADKKAASDNIPPEINRRKVIQGIGATGFALAMPSIVRAQELRKIRMGFGIKSVNPIIINILISEQLGYTKEEGLAFTPVVLAYEGWSYWVFRKRIAVHHIPA